MLNKNLLYLAVATALSGCVPDMYRHINGDETYCYLCLGYYHSNGEKEAVIDHDEEVLKDAIEHDALNKKTP